MWTAPGNLSATLPAQHLNNVIYDQHVVPFRIPILSHPTRMSAQDAACTSHLNHDHPVVANALLSTDYEREQLEHPSKPLLRPLIWERYSLIAQPGADCSQQSVGASTVIWQLGSASRSSIRGIEE